jgi:hypothetical protein
MDQTFFVFLVLFGLLIVYLFKQKDDLTDMKQELNQFVNQEHFVGNKEPDEEPVEVNEIDLTKPQTALQIGAPETLYNEPEPMNKPDTPIKNGYSTTLIFNHPDKINGCDIVNIAPMNYYKEINQNLEKSLNNNVMNGGNFGDVTGNLDDAESGYFHLF